MLAFSAVGEALCWLLLRGGLPLLLLPRPSGEDGSSFARASRFFHLEVSRTSAKPLPPLDADCEVATTGGEIERELAREIARGREAEE